MNIGIIGLGVQGRIRLNAIRALNGSHKVVLVNDVQRPQHADFAGIPFANDYRTVIDDKSVDAVMVCTPNYLTKEIVVAALNQGKHVFSEKPPGRNLAEIEEMITAERANPGAKLMFGFNHRHHESIVHAKKIVDSGDLGRLLWIRGRYGKSVDENFGKTWRAKRETAGGGILLDQGIHMLDLFLMMVGDFDEVKSFVSNLFWNLDVEDNVFAMFKNR
ncbi:MAG: Gfo/Idh/MocA family oxidoreductase, partial [Pseudomonadota bacterium]